MAERSVVASDPSSLTKFYVWTGLLNGDTGAPIQVLDFGDMTVTVEGTFGSGGTIKLRGSNDGTNYYDLTDPQGNAISKSAAGIEAVIEAPVYVRPEVTAGDGSTDLQCRIMARKGSR